MPITLRVKRVKFCFTDTENVYATFNTILASEPIDLKRLKIKKIKKIKKK